MSAARLESLKAHKGESEHAIQPMSASTIWIVELDDHTTALQPITLPEVRKLGALALLHLDVDDSGDNGFILFAAFKQADVGEETHGVNVYGEKPESLWEHYSGMGVEAINHGTVMRLERRHGRARPSNPLSALRPRQHVARPLLAVPQHRTGPLAQVAELVNVARPLAFCSDPHSQFQAEKSLRVEGLRILGYYHSHPGGGIDLSPEDRHFATRADWIYVVVATGWKGQPPHRLAAWRRLSSGDFAPTQLD